MGPVWVQGRGVGVGPDSFGELMVFVNSDPHYLILGETQVVPICCQRQQVALKNSLLAVT